MANPVNRAIINERIAKLLERKLPAGDVQYEQAAALWTIAKELMALVDQRQSE